MKRIIIIALGLAMVLVMASCGNSDSSNNDPASSDMISVVIDIDYPDSSGVADVDDVKVQIADGSSVLDVLNAYADDNNMKIVMDESSDTPYVTSINDVAATDSAGWVYEVNDEMVMDSADKHKVKKGDKIDWSFESWSDSEEDDD